MLLWVLFSLSGILSPPIFARRNLIDYLRLSLNPIFSIVPPLRT
jgi:hypothetical protein